MKNLIQKIICAVVLLTSLSSFSGIGGESYTIHLNEKLIVQHYLTSKAVTPSFSLDQSSINDQLSVYYNECGQIGKHRKLTIKDEKDQVLKELGYVDATNEHSPMTIKVKDVISAKKNAKSLKLFYQSDKVNGRLLATIKLGDEVKAMR